MKKEPALEVEDLKLTEDTAEEEEVKLTMNPTEEEITTVVKGKQKKTAIKAKRPKAGKAVMDRFKADVSKYKLAILETLNTLIKNHELMPPDTVYERFIEKLPEFGNQLLRTAMDFNKFNESSTTSENKISDPKVMSCIITPLDQAGGQFLELSGQASTSSNAGNGSDDAKVEASVIVSQHEEVQASAQAKDQVEPVKQMETPKRVPLETAMDFPKLKEVQASDFAKHQVEQVKQMETPKRVPLVPIESADSDEETMASKKTGRKRKKIFQRTSLERSSKLKKSEILTENIPRSSAKDKERKAKKDDSENKFLNKTAIKFIKKVNQQ